MVDTAWLPTLRLGSRRSSTDLGYESSLVARSLRSHRTSVIGIIVPDLEPFSTELLKGAARAIHSTGYELIVCAGDGHVGAQVGWEHRYLSRLNGTLADGTLLVTPTVVDVAHKRAGCRRRSPRRRLPLADRRIPEPGGSDDGNRLFDRARPSADRVHRRPSRPGVGPSSRAGLSQRAGAGPRSSSILDWSVSASTPGKQPRVRPMSCSR